MPLPDLAPKVLAALVVYAGMSVATFVAYGFDKSAARKGRRRVPTKTLHLLALLGGWPGALLAMPVFRHKRQTTSFVIMLRLIVLAHVAAMLLLLA